MINPDNNTVTGTVRVGGNPFGVAVSPTSGYAFVANNASGTVSVINPSTNVVTATIAVGTGPFGVAVDPGTGAVYVTNGGESTVSVIHG